MVELVRREVHGAHSSGGGREQRLPGRGPCRTVRTWRDVVSRETVDPQTVRVTHHLECQRA